MIEIAEIAQRNRYCRFIPIDSFADASLEIILSSGYSYM